MGTETSSGPGMTWLYFVFLTIGCWGIYGILLHKGVVTMGDPENGRYKAYLFVGLAYFLTAVLAPLGLLILKGASWTYPAKGMIWSLVAGVAGAIGAFGVLLAFSAKGTPPVVMSLVFAGAPIINAVVALLIHPPAGGWAALNWKFILGIILAATGAAMVMKFKPGDAPKPKPAQAQTSTPSTP